MNNVYHKLKVNELFKGSIWYTLSNLLVKGINFLTIPLFTRILSPYQYGIVNNFIAWVSIGTVIIGLNLNTAISNAKFDYDTNMDEFLSTLMYFSVLFFTVVLLVTNIVIAFTVGDFSQKLILNSVMIQSFSMYLISFATTYFTIETKYVKNTFISFLTVFSNVVLSLIFMVTIFKDKPDLGRIYGSTAGLLVLSAFIIARFIQIGSIKINKDFLIYALKISLPVIPHSLGGIILSQFDRIMITQYSGNTEAGIYSYIYNISMIVNVLWLSINNAWIPWFYKRMTIQKFEEIKRNIKRSTYIFLIVTMLCTTLLTDLSKIIAPSSYYDGITLIIPICISYFFMFLYSFPVNYEFFLKKTSYIGISTVISAVINILLNIYYIPRYGYQAAGYTTLVTYILLFIFHYYVAQRISTANNTKFLESNVFIFSIIIIMFYGAGTLFFIGNIFEKYMVLVICMLMVIVKNKLKKVKGK